MTDNDEYCSYVTEHVTIVCTALFVTCHQWPVTSRINVAIVIVTGYFQTHLTAVQQHYIFSLDNIIFHHYSDWVCTAVMSNDVMKDLRG